MGAALTVTRTDHSAAELRSIAGRCRDAAQVRLLLALASVLDSRPRSEAAAQNGMDRQTLRDWVHRYNAEGIDGLKSHTSPGRAPALTDAQMAALKTLVIAGPNPAEHKVVTGDAQICRPKSRDGLPLRCMRARSGSGCGNSARPGSTSSLPSEEGCRRGGDF